MPAREYQRAEGHHRDLNAHQHGMDQPKRVDRMKRNGAPARCFGIGDLVMMVRIKVRDALAARHDLLEPAGIKRLEKTVTVPSRLTVLTSTSRSPPAN